MREREQMEKARLREILIRKEREERRRKAKVQTFQGNYYPPTEEDLAQMKAAYIERQENKMEYLKNRQKNKTAEDNIFARPPPKTQTVTTPEIFVDDTMTKADKIRIQKEYAQFLDSQVNAKKLQGGHNIGGNGLDEPDYSRSNLEAQNPYQELREKNNKLKEIPRNPYSRRNYEIGSNSYLKSNPITNPVNTYHFVDRRPSGRLQSGGNNVIRK